jgi:hypothetical protein
LEKFFDKVNHDILMARVARKVKDKQVLRLVRSRQQPGAVDGRRGEWLHPGTSQGGHRRRCCLDLKGESMRKTRSKLTKLG